MVRAANEKIVEIAESTGFSAPVPLMCECGDPQCAGFFRVSADAFKLAATQPHWFITGDAHGVRYAVNDAESGEEVLRAAA